MSQALAVTQDQVGEAIAQVRGERTLTQLKSVLPENVPVTRFVRAAVTAISENPDLVTVDRDSLFLSLVKCAQDGLLPDGREAALIPFNDRKRGRIATYIPMIGGFRKIAGEHGWSIETAVVHENDVFEFERGSEPRVVHRQPKLGAERGPMIGAYAIGRHRSMPTQIVVLDAGEVEKIKATSKALNFGPWKDWEPQMWEKTAGRKLFKQLPLGERETERIRRMLSESNVVDADAALYGPQRAELTESARGGAPASPPVERPSDPGDAATGAAGGGSSAAAGAPVDTTADEDPRFVAAAPAPAERGVLSEETLAAGMTVLPAKTKHGGKTIQQVAEEGDLDYLAYYAQATKDRVLKGALGAFLAGWSEPV